MKETGVIRKIDELGRVVIPKEIRKTLGIKDGENLEIFLDNKKICLQKHSMLFTLEELANILVRNAMECMNLHLIVMDRDQVIASWQKEQVGICYTEILQTYLEQREVHVSTQPENLLKKDVYAYFYVYPLIVSGDVFGLLILQSNQEILETMKNFVSFVAKILLYSFDNI